ncbi:MAG: sulfur carrier protein ThiS [Acidimicrobiales bacterium]|jgi:sulfur carrier protein
MIRVNGIEHDGAFDSLTAMMNDMAIEPKGVAVAINGEVIRRGEWSTTSLHDGDVIEIVNAVAGG